MYKSILIYILNLRYIKINSKDKDTVKLLSDCKNAEQSSKNSDKNCKH